MDHLIRTLLPQRRHLPHAIPSWVADGARYFITINCRKRGHDALCRAVVFDALVESLLVYERLGRWHPWLMIVMPDHVHMIVSFDRRHGIRQTVSAWKRYLARTVGIEWQSSFFEHRLRSDRESDEKSSYMRENPVRKGLVRSFEEWPYAWERSG